MWHVQVHEHVVALPLTGMAVIVALVLEVQSVKTVPNLSPKSSYITITAPGALG